MSTHPAYQLTIAARATADLRGHTSATLRIPVTDSGTKPLSVDLHAANVTTLAREYPGAGWVRSITPHSLTLRPGQTRWFTLHVQVPPGASRGMHALNFIAQSRPVSSGQIAASAGVGGTLRMLRPGHVAALAIHGPHVITQSPAGHGYLPVVLLILAGAAVALGLAALLLRRQRRVRRAT